MYITSYLQLESDDNVQSNSVQEDEMGDERRIY